MGGRLAYFSFMRNARRACSSVHRRRGRIALHPWASSDRRAERSDMLIVSEGWLGKRLWRAVRDFANPASSIRIPALRQVVTS